MSGMGKYKAALDVQRFPAALGVRVLFHDIGFFGLFFLFHAFSQKVGEDVEVM